MIRAGFLDSESRQDLIDLARDGSVAHRLARRANALFLLEDGMSCEAVAKVLYLDDDTIRTWHRRYQEDGVEGLANFGHEGGTCRLTAEQQDKLKAWIAAALPRTTREVGAWIGRECRADRAAAPPGHGTPQAEIDLTQAGSGKASGLHQGIRGPDEPDLRG